MDIVTTNRDIPIRAMGRDTALTIATMDHWQTLIPPAPHHFGGTSNAVEVSPPIYHYCIAGYDNQTIGMCTGKGTKNGVGTVLRIPEGAKFDPDNPASLPPPGPNIRLSGLWCYYNARTIHGTGSRGDGAVVAYSLDGLMRRGIVLEERWPDTEANQAAYSDRIRLGSSILAAGAEHKVKDCARIQDKNQFFDFVANGFPIVIGKPIGEGWLQTNDAGVFSLGGRIIGGHCTLCVGYDRRKNEVYTRNSWLTWGQRTDDPAYKSSDPIYGGNAQGRNNIGICPLDQYESMYLGAASFSSGQVDAFVVNNVPGFAKPKILTPSNSEAFF